MPMQINAIKNSVDKNGDEDGRHKHAKDRHTSDEGALYLQADRAGAM